MGRKRRLFWLIWSVNKLEKELKKETDKGPSKTSGDETHCMLGKKDCLQSGDEFKLTRFKYIVEKLITAFQF